MRKTKIRIIFLWLFIFVFAGLYLSKDFVVGAVAKKQIGKIFLDSQVSLEAARLGISGLRLKNLSIQNRDFPYQITLDNLEARFSLLSLLQKSLKQIKFSGLNINIDSAAKTPQDFLSKLSLNSKGGFAYERIILSDIKTKINLKDITTDTAISLDLALTSLLPEINYLHAESKFSSFFGAQINSLYFNLDSINQDNRFSIKEFSFNKFKLKDFEAKLNISNNKISCESFKSGLFNASITGAAFGEFKTGAVKYALNAEVLGLDLERLSKDLAIEEKVEMTGLFDGNLLAEGQNNTLTKLSGTLNARPEGGRFIIKDERMLAALNSTKNQRVQLTLEGLQDYTYKVGKISLLKEDNKIIISILLDGDKGKINIPLVLHDFLK